MARKHHSATGSGLRSLLRRGIFGLSLVMLSLPAAASDALFAPEHDATLDSFHSYVDTGTTTRRASPLPIPDVAQLVAETRRFRLVATPQAEGVARAMSLEVEALRDRIAADLGVDYDGVTEVRIADRPAAFQALQPYEQRAPSWAVGVAWPSYNLVILSTARGRSPAEIRRTLAHEISHVALGRLAPRRFPRWFLEGMAIYHSEDWSFARAGSIANAVVRDGIIPLHDLDQSWPDTPGEVRLAYAQSIDFVAWLFRTQGKPAIHKMVSEVIGGREIEEAFEVAMGIPLWKLELEWRSGLSLRYTWIPAITSGGFFWALAALLFVVAYARRRRIKRQRLAAMEAEEEWLYPEDDVGDEQAPNAPEASEMNGTGVNHETKPPW